MGLAGDEFQIFYFPQCRPSALANHLRTTAFLYFFVILEQVPITNRHINLSRFYSEESF